MQQGVTFGGTRILFLEDKETINKKTKYNDYLIKIQGRDIHMEDTLLDPL
jgi:hypothetical protein